MSAFEFVFGIIAIISSLALTQIITGVVAIIRHRDRGGFSLVHSLWMWIAFAVVVGNLGALWQVGGHPDWPNYRVLAWIASMTALYAFCTLVVPEVHRGEPLDLAEFHEREGRRYIVAHNVFTVVALVMVSTISGVDSESARNLVPAALGLGLGLAALFTRGTAQLAISGVLAVMATGFMLANLSILSTGAQ